MDKGATLDGKRQALRLNIGQTRALTTVSDANGATLSL